MQEIIFLNCYGDVTVTWEEKDNKEMEKRITKLIDDGHQFFIIKKKWFGKSKKERLYSIRELKKNEINASSDTLTNLFSGLDASVLKGEEESYNVVKSSTIPAEIVKSKSVCSKPAVGG